MNPRQRRGVVLMSLAAVGAVAVFLMVFNYVDGISRQVGPMTTTYEFVRAIPRLQAVAQEDLRPVTIPRQWMPAAALTSYNAASGLVAATNIPKGAILQDGLLMAPPELKPGEQEIAILIDAETGVAGKIKAGDLVDIYGTFDSNDNAEARVLVVNARVLAIGALQTAEQVDSGSDHQQLQESQVVPVTFALTIEESLRVTYAESFATKVRLALVAPGTESKADPKRDILRQSDVLASGMKPTAAAGKTPAAAGKGVSR